MAKSKILILMKNPSLNPQSLLLNKIIKDSLNQIRSNNTSFINIGTSSVNKFRFYLLIGYALALIA